jgi:IclR family acetate operon transcriptional repressor
MSALARTLGVPKTTVHRMLRTLGEAGWIAPEGAPGEQRWSLTPRALAVGASVMNQVDLREIARPIISELSASIDENIHLAVPDGKNLVLIERVPSSRPVQTVQKVGDRAPMSVTASGCAYLSRLPRAEAKAFLPAKISFASGGSLSRVALLNELESVAARGYAINPGRWRPEVSAIGSAVLGKDNRPVAAMSISMPSYRFTEDLYEPYGSLVRDATAQVTEKIARL